jgi:hypothetical protein
MFWTGAMIGFGVYFVLDVLAVVVYLILRKRGVFAS